MLVNIVLAFVIGAIYAVALYLMMRRNIVKLIIGLALLSHGTNLLIFTAGGLVRGEPPVVATGREILESPYPDPLPQALILTAIVISFAVLAFAVILIHRVHELGGSDDTDSFKTTEP